MINAELIFRTESGDEESLGEILWPALPSKGDRISTSIKGKDMDGVVGGISWFYSGWRKMQATVEVLADGETANEILASAAEESITKLKFNRPGP